ncbi:rCG37604 [Rattus norvegicus]|uniref:RCG37604 n=1 Tax=Rattus norvegicus TaxID=10116 RepID=A6K7Y3_RAT|nr:rCG37604 [Rattus norvegicus]
MAVPFPHGDAEDGYLPPLHCINEEAEVSRVQEICPKS